MTGRPFVRKRNEDRGNERRTWPPDWTTSRPVPAGRMPRWVKLFWIVSSVLVLLLLVMLFAGHDHGRHMHGGLGSPAAAGTTSGVCRS